MLIDLDDTILKFNSNYKQSWKKAIYQVDQLKSARNRILKEFIRQCVTPVLTLSERPYKFSTREERLNLIHKIFISQKIENKELELELENAFFLARDEKISPFPHALSTLEFLNSIGINCVLVSNGTSERQRSKISKFHLGPYFSHIVISEEIGYEKPSPEIFQYAMELTGHDHRTTWMIGDSYQSDIIGAKSTGIFSVMISKTRPKVLNKRTTPLPDIIVKSFNEVGKIFR